MRYIVIVFVLSSFATAVAQDTLCEERVPVTCHWTESYPFNNICRLYYDHYETGNTYSYGTGFLVGPHCVLTNGHCVYNRSEGHPLLHDVFFKPGQCKEVAGATKYAPFGSRYAERLKTNSKYADTSYTPKYYVDYGAINFVCPFKEIGTFLPLCFDVEPEFMNMAGYPTADLPDDDWKHTQWNAFGKLNHVYSRGLRYDGRSTGGASGSPVWRWENNELLLEVVGLNSTHSNDCDGGGPRLVWNNYDLIREWMNWRPTMAQLMEEGCISFEPVPFDLLLEYFLEHSEQMISIEALHIAHPAAPPTASADRRKMQIVRHGFYEWVEFDLEPLKGQEQGPRILQFLRAPGVDLEGVAWEPGMPFQPDNPQSGWLSRDKAQMFLSASAGRAEPPYQGVEAAFVEDWPAISYQAVHEGPWSGEDDQDDVPLEDPDCAGDFNNDGIVDGGDLGMMLAAWGDCTSQPCDIDLNSDGQIDGGDLGSLLALFGECP